MPPVQLTQVASPGPSIVMDFTSFLINLPIQPKQKLLTDLLPAGIIREDCITVPHLHRTVTIPIIRLIVVSGLSTRPKSAAHATPTGCTADNSCLLRFSNDKTNRDTVKAYYCPNHPVETIINFAPPDCTAAGPFTRPYFIVMHPGGMLTPFLLLFMFFFPSLIYPEKEDKSNAFPEKTFHKIYPEFSSLFVAIYCSIRILFDYESLHIKKQSVQTFHISVRTVFYLYVFIIYGTVY